MSSVGEKFKEALEAMDLKTASATKDEAKAFEALMIDSLELAKELASKGARGEKLTAKEVQYIKSFTQLFALSLRN